MKKILFTLFLFLVFCIPSFSAETIFVPNITTEQAKKAINVYMMTQGWTFKNETDYLLCFEKTYETWVEPSKAKMNQYRYLKEHSELPNFYYQKPEGHYETHTDHSQFIFAEKNGLSIITDLSSYESKKLQKIVFTGYYTYNIEYKIPLLKRHIVISDNIQTNYTSSNRIGNEKKIVKINDKNVKDYTKKEIEDIFNNVPIEKLKLESDNKKVYYLLRTFIEPIYKQYL